MGNGKRGEMKKWAFTFITVLYALFAFFWSGLLPQEIAAGEEVEQMHELKTQKKDSCCTLLLNCGDPLPSEVRSSRSPAKFK